MKRVAHVISPQVGYFDPVQKLCQANGVTFEAIHDVDILDDGTVSGFYEMNGTRSQILEIFDGTSPRLVDVEVITDGDVTMVRLRYQPTDLVRKLLEPHRNYGVIVQYPMEFVGPDRSSLRVTVVGSEDAVQELITKHRGFTDLTIENVTSYHPSAGREFSDLTDRQREVLLTAYERGYYEDPRQTTYEDIAAEFDCSASSIGQILRRTESTLVGAIVPDRTIDRAGH